MVVEQEAEGPTKLVCFELQGQEYSADIRYIKESLTVRPITGVALTPSWMSGIINLRGDVVAILDLSLFFGMPATEIRPETRIIIARHEGRRLGFLCDRLSDLRIQDLEQTQHPPATLPEGATAVLAGVLTLGDGRALRILDIAALFESKQLMAFRRREPS